MAEGAERQRDPGMAKAVRFVRTLRDWSQHQLARASGIGQDQISRYESGRITPSPASLRRLAAAARIPVALVELVLPYLREMAARESRSPAPEEGDGPEAARPLAIAVAGVVEAEVGWVLDQLAATAGAADRAEAPSPADRAIAEGRWRHLAGLAESDQVILVEHGREYRTWAFCEWLGAESERSAAENPRRAIALARLAVRAAAGITGEPGWRSRVSGHAWAQVGNALRVANDHAGAEQAFATSRQLREEGEGPAGLLDEARPFDLEASLRRDQRRFGEALHLHERALTLAPQGSAAYILVNKAVTLEQSGSYQEAITTLFQAAPELEGEHPSRLHFALRFNLATNWWHLQRYQEAAAILPEVRRLAASLDQALDLVRVRWLEARVAAGLGREQEAIAGLEQVQEEFAVRGLPYDMALAALDLAALYLEAGRTGEVKALTARMIAVFGEQDVAREARLAAQTFERALRTERATVALVERLARYLDQVRQEPRLRFRE